MIDVVDRPLGTQLTLPMSPMLKGRRPGTGMRASVEAGRRSRDAGDAERSGCDLPELQDQTDGRRKRTPPAAMPQKRERRALTTSVVGNAADRLFYPGNLTPLMVLGRPLHKHRRREQLRDHADLRTMENEETRVKRPRARRVSDANSIGANWRSSLKPPPKPMPNPASTPPYGRAAWPMVSWGLPAVLRIQSASFAMAP